MAGRWFLMEDFIVRPPTGENHTAEIIWRSLNHTEFSIFHFVLSAAITSVSVLGVITNTINVVIFSKTKYKDGVDVCFLALAVSDFLCALFGTMKGISMLFLTVEMYVGPHYRTDPIIPYYFTGGLTLIFFTQSAFITMFIAVVRCICVLLPLRFKTMFTADRCLIVIVICAFISIAINLPSVAAVKLIPKTEKAMKAVRLARRYLPGKPELAAMVKMTSHLIVPFMSETVLMFCCFLMTWAMKRSAKFRKQTSSAATVEGGSKEQESEKSSKLTQKELKVVQQILVVCLVYIMCNTPDLVFGILSSFFSELQERGKREGFARLYKCVKLIRHIFIHLNGALNVFVYSKYNTKFRELLAEKFTCLRQD